MWALTRHCVRAAVITTLVVLSLAIGAGAVRLLPWLLSPDVPLAVALPFARALLAVAFEAAFLIGVPVGFALGAALLVERGEARALHTLGVSPLGLGIMGLVPLAALATLAFAVTMSWPAGGEKPGLFAKALIERARESCESGVAESVPVPIVGITWLCFEQLPPRITGTVPGSRGLGWFSARQIRVNEEFTSFQAEDVYVGMRPQESTFRVGLRVKQATVSGLPTWGASSPWGPFERSGVIALVLVLVGFSGVYVVSHLAWTSFALAGGCAGLAGVASLRVLHAQAEATPATAAFEVLAVGLGVQLVPLLLVPLLGWCRQKLRRNLSVP